MRAHKTSAGRGFWCGVLLACALFGIASARMIGGRNTLAVPTDGDFKSSTGRGVSAVMSVSRQIYERIQTDPYPLQISQVSHA